MRPLPLFWQTEIEEDSESSRAEEKREESTGIPGQNSQGSVLVV